MKINVIKLISILLTVFFWVGLIITVCTSAVVASLAFKPSILKGAEINSYNHITVGIFNISYHNNSVLPPDLLTAPLFFVLLTLLCWYFRKIFKNLSQGKLFVSNNANAIIIIGILLLINSLIISLPDLLIAKQLLPKIHIDNGQVNASYNIPTPLFIASVLIIFLGVFFHKAVKIASENELTI
ncbi:DUF2975 domain-containing protein [Bacillus sp. BRMEA1]|uniref:DUF2975 domain-containing protein n=1 Tax=Neobacillus endophyticus TaxID=2738405 RepID=UPI001565C4E4|nr:DUF2975 domain-containing protein [Neobacillus endophyticus]NRD78513.1 DUF2975 domain-containing protein [Neobacillus endophyticus]